MKHYLLKGNNDSIIEFKYTGAVKNQFGCVSGTQKAAWHTKLPDAVNFSKMLLDFNSVVKTSFEWKYSKCIRCFCCQELCPRGAIVIKDKRLSNVPGLK